MVAGDGFEPSKASLADLQSAPFDRSGIQPYFICIVRFWQMERVTGVEPVYPAWKAGAQPLCHTRSFLQNIWCRRGELNPHSGERTWT